MKLSIYAGLLLLAGVAFIFAVLHFLGGYGILLVAGIVAGLVNESTE